MSNPPIINFSGDRVGCLGWLGFSRRRLGMLERQMTGANLVQNKSVVYPQPGVKIICSKQFGTTRINIFVDQVVSRGSRSEKFYYWYTIISGGTLHYLMDVVTDGMQNVWLCGGYSDSLAPYWLGESVLIAKHDTDGELILSKTLIQQTEFEFANSMCVDSSNNLYITLDHYSANNVGTPALPTYDGALIKFSNSGVVQWSRKFGLANTAIQNTDSQVGVSGIYTCGWVNDWVQTLPPLNWANSVRWIGFINKFSNTGTLMWKRILYYSYTVSPTHFPDGQLKIERIALDGDDNCYGIGLDTGDVNYVNGSAGWGQGTIFKFNSSGTLQWQKQIYSVVDTIAGDSFWTVDIVPDSENNLRMLCVHADPIDATFGNFIFYLIKLTSAGVISWQRSFTVPYSSGEGNWSLTFPTNPRLAIGRNDEVFVLTSNYNEIGGHLLFKFSSDGNLIWQRGMSSTEFDLSLSRVVIDPDGDILITGDDTLTLQGFTIKLPGSGAFSGSHRDMNFASSGLVIGKSGVAIRAADSGGLLIIGSTLYNDWAGTYETEDLGLTGKTTKIIIDEYEINRGM